MSIFIRGIRIQCDKRVTGTRRLIRKAGDIAHILHMTYALLCRVRNTHFSNTKFAAPLCQHFTKKVLQLFQSSRLFSSGFSTIIKSSSNNSWPSTALHSKQKKLFSTTIQHRWTVWEINEATSRKKQQKSPCEFLCCSLHTQAISISNTKAVYWQIHCQTKNVMPIPYDCCVCCVWYGVFM